MKTIIRTEKAPAPIGPYNQAIVAGNTIYVSGQIAIDAASGELKLGDLVAETKLVLDNLGAVLEEAGYGFGDVVKCSIFLKDMNDFGTVNEIYGTYFTSDPPARECVEVAKLPKDVNVEISCIAVKAK